jgi:hypothetical protein
MRRLTEWCLAALLPAAMLLQSPGAAAGPAEGLADPRLAANLDGVADWSVQHPFVDRMKSARPWIGHSADEWGRWSAEALREAGHVGADGWPRSLPAGATRLEALVLTDQPEDIAELAGRYVLRWTGAGRVEVTGRTRLISQRPGEIVFHYAPGDGLVAIAVKSTDPEGTGDHIRDMTLVREEHLELHEAGVLFNPAWIARVQDLRSVRFVNWMNTSDTTLERWADRPRPDHQSWGMPSGGVPVEVMVALANEIGADPWFTLPHRADDDFVRRFAQYVRDHLDPRLRAHVEYSNEVWNFLFPQAHWAAEQARARWGAADQTGWVQFAGMRAAEVADIWRGVFGEEAEARLRTVVGVQTGWLGLEEAILQAPLAVAEGRAPPVDSFDQYAVTGYFGDVLDPGEDAQRLRRWLEGGRESAFARLAEEIREGSLLRLLDEVLPYHARVAERHGLDLVMYEGGTHVTAPEIGDPELAAFIQAFNYTPEVAALYEMLLDGWRTAGGTLFNAYVDVARPSRWGSWGALRHPWDENPRWDVLMTYNETAAPWESRAPGTFLHGVLREGGEGADRLEGTPEEDNLLGGPGDDLLDGRGGADRLHGGPGRDRAHLPGSADEWTFLTDGDAVLAERDRVTLRLVSVEEVSFADDEGLIFLTDSLR